MDYAKAFIENFVWGPSQGIDISPDQPFVRPAKWNERIAPFIPRESFFSASSSGLDRLAKACEQLKAKGEARSIDKLLKIKTCVLDVGFRASLIGTTIKAAAVAKKVLKLANTSSVPPQEVSLTYISTALQPQWFELSPSYNIVLGFAKQLQGLFPEEAQKIANAVHERQLGAFRNRFNLSRPSSGGSDMGPEYESPENWAQTVIQSILPKLLEKINPTINRTNWESRLTDFLKALWTPGLDYGRQYDEILTKLQEWFSKQTFTTFESMDLLQKVFKWNPVPEETQKALRSTYAQSIVTKLEQALKGNKSEEQEKYINQLVELLRTQGRYDSQNKKTYFFAVQFDSTLAVDPAMEAQLVSLAKRFAQRDVRYRSVQFPYDLFSKLSAAAGRAYLDQFLIGLTELKPRDDISDQLKWLEKMWENRFAFFESRVAYNTFLKEQFLQIVKEAGPRLLELKKETALSVAKQMNKVSEYVDVDKKILSESLGEHYTTYLDFIKEGRFNKVIKGCETLESATDQHPTTKGSLFVTLEEYAENEQEISKLGRPSTFVPSPIKLTEALNKGIPSFLNKKLSPINLLALGESCRKINELFGFSLLSFEIPKEVFDNYLKAFAKKEHYSLWDKVKEPEFRGKRKVPEMDPEKLIRNLPITEDQKNQLIDAYRESLKDIQTT